MKRFVLLIEDDAALSATLAELLEQAGYEVARASDGEQALDLLAHSPIPSLVVVDLILPRLDGWQLIEVLDGFAPIPILAISGLPESKLAKATPLAPRARRTVTVLPKPFRSEEFLALVDSLAAHAPAARPPDATAR